MDTKPDKPGVFGVLTSLKEEGDSCRLILDDVEGMEKDGEWRKLSLFTWKDIPRDKFDDLSFSDDELADFGRFVLVRLKALVHPTPPEVIDEGAVRWGNEFQLDITKEGSKQRIVLKLSEPIESKRDGDYIRLVSLKGLFESDMRIYGFDSAQARALSIEFVCNVLQDYEVRSPDGQVVSLEKLLAK